MGLKPLGDRVIVKALEQDEKTASGIYLPDTAKEKPQRGTVVAVGEGRWIDDGKVQELAVKKGDKILFSKYAGTEIKVEGKKLMILRQSDLLAIVG